jgi:hypothetical protein
VQPRHKGATDTTSKETGEQMVQALHEVGFETVTLLLKPMRPVATACAIATA